MTIPELIRQPVLDEWPDVALDEGVEAASGVESVEAFPCIEVPTDVGVGAADRAQRGIDVISIANKGGVQLIQPEAVQAPTHGIGLVIGPVKPRCLDTVREFSDHDLEFGPFRLARIFTHRDIEEAREVVLPVPFFANEIWCFQRVPRQIVGADFRQGHTEPRRSEQNRARPSAWIRSQLGWQRPVFRVMAARTRWHPRLRGVAGESVVERFDSSGEFRVHVYQSGAVTERRGRCFRSP